MSFEPDRTNWYLQGIRRAEQAGLIAYASQDAGGSVVSDDYGHIYHGDGAPLSLRYSNTRPLSFVARQLLSLYRNEPATRLLELGPGAGIACATMARLLPAARIDTISLTPLNPYLIFRDEDVYDRIMESILDEQRLLSFYHASFLPFVHNQYIGKFPGDINIMNDSYHFVYENHGPIFYSGQPREDTDPTELPRTIAAALSLLRRNGTMVIMASDGSYATEDLLESAALDTDIIVACKRTTDWHSFPCIVAREGSPLATRLREDKNGLLAKSERVLRLEYQVFEKVISEICTRL